MAAINLSDKFERDMIKNSPKWSVGDFSSAMENAIYQRAAPRLIRKSHNKVAFNGFWRDGDKQNVCVWLDKATWHDAKTGEGGGCKEFAKTVFNMTLPEFMQSYGSINMERWIPTERIIPFAEDEPANNKSVQELWCALKQAEESKEDLASRWLIEKRGITAPRETLRADYANLQSTDVELFDSSLRNFIAQRTGLSPQIVVPLRSTTSSDVRNLFIRSIFDVAKEDKSRLLPNYGGWHEPDGTPRAFGYPHLIKDSSHLILCEGMADYFSAKFLIHGRQEFLPIGAANADALNKWAQWLIASKYKGMVTILHQLDADGPCALSTKKIGPAKAIAAVRLLKENQIKTQLFNWPVYLTCTSTHPSLINDIADSLSTEAIYKESGQDHLRLIFLLTLTKDKEL